MGSTNTLGTIAFNCPAALPSASILRPSNFTSVNNILAAFKSNNSVASGSTWYLGALGKGMNFIFLHNQDKNQDENKTGILSSKVIR